MITLELLTEFVRGPLRYNKDIECDSFIILTDFRSKNKILDIKLINLSKIRGFGEVVKLEKYYNWLQSIREEKINQIL
jgi:hypothetical protein